MTIVVAAIVAFEIGMEFAQNITAAIVSFPQLEFYRRYYHFLFNIIRVVTC